MPLQNLKKKKSHLYRTTVYIDEIFLYDHHFRLKTQSKSPMTVLTPNQIHLDGLRFDPMGELNSAVITLGEREGMRKERKIEGRRSMGKGRTELRSVHPFFWRRFVTLIM